MNIKTYFPFAKKQELRGNKAIDINFVCLFNAFVTRTDWTGRQLHGISVIGASGCVIKWLISIFEGKWKGKWQTLIVLTCNVSLDQALPWELARVNVKPVQERQRNNELCTLWKQFFSIHNSCMHCAKQFFFCVCLCVRVHACLCLIYHWNEILCQLHMVKYCSPGRANTTVVNPAA